MDFKTVKFKVRDQVFCEDLSIFNINDSAIEALFSGRHINQIEDGFLYIDRDPLIFSKLIDFLKSDRLSVPSDQ